MRVSRFTAIRASALGALGIMVLTLAACASLGPVQVGDVAIAPLVLPTISPTPPPSPIPSNGNDTLLPRMIIPAAGGPPVLGIPLTMGGNIFLPATGGPPVIGTPLFP